jgi:hypothetical protein
MARKKLPDHLLKYPRKGTNKGLRKPYNTKALEQRGISYKEPLIIKSFWQNHTMDQVQSMSDEEIMQAIDKYLDGFIYRQTKRDKQWNFPIKPEYLSIARYEKK